MERKVDDTGTPTLPDTVVRIPEKKDMEQALDHQDRPLGINIVANEIDSLLMKTVPDPEKLKTLDDP